MVTQSCPCLRLPPHLPLVSNTYLIHRFPGAGEQRFLSQHWDGHKDLLGKLGWVLTAAVSLLVLGCQQCTQQGDALKANHPPAPVPGSICPAAPSGLGDLVLIQIIYPIWVMAPRTSVPALAPGWGVDPSSPHCLTLGVASCRSVGPQAQQPLPNKTIQDSGQGERDAPPLFPCRFLAWELGKKKQTFFSSFRQARFSKLKGYPGITGSAPRDSLPSDTWAYIQTKP